jgi:glycosyltransferase involved in cell wall biosynthesis
MSLKGASARGSRKHRQIREKECIIPYCSDMPPSISLVSWALNEESNVGEFVMRSESFLSPIASEFEVLIIDDGSTDSTWNVLQEHQKSRPWLKLVKNTQNRGVGVCTRIALAEATCDYVLWQTQDWSYDLSWFETNADQIGLYDVIHGSRWLASRGLGKYFERSDTPWKALVSLTNYGLIRLLFGVPFSDVQNVTLFPRSLAQSFQLQSESSFTNPECLIRAWEHGISILEVPVPFRPREKGVAKGTRLPAIARALRDILIFRIRYRMDPKAKSHLLKWEGT